MIIKYVRYIKSRTHMTSTNYYTCFIDGVPTEYYVQEYLAGDVCLYYNDKYLILFGYFEDWRKLMSDYKIT